MSSEDSVHEESWVLRVQRRSSNVCCRYVLKEVRGKGGVCPYCSKKGTEWKTSFQSGGTHLARLHTLVGLKDALPAVLSLGWTSLLMGSTRGEVLNPAHLSHIQAGAPL